MVAITTLFYLHPIYPGYKLPHWNLKKANWISFREQCSNQLNENLPINTQNMMLYFAESVILIANNAVPKTSTNTTKPNKPWVNEDCKQAIKNENLLLPSCDTILLFFSLLLLPAGTPSINPCFHTVLSKAFSFSCP